MGALRSIATLLALAVPGVSAAQTGAGDEGQSAMGAQVIGIVGVQWPTAVESFEATGLDSRPREFGGGLQITNLWRELFAQVTVTATSDTGQRVFVDDGTVFPLGIPLTVKATYFDMSGGWKVKFPGRAAQRIVPYAAAGLGVVRYRETSPFAETGDDVDESSISYHVQGGVEVGITRWLGLSADVRYRRVPDLLGLGGVSAAFGEDDFGGVNASLGVRVTFPRSGARAPSDAPRDDPSAPPPTRVPGALERATESNSAVTIAQAPVYLRMDPSLEPLRTLEAGTSVKVLAELDTWVRIEFYDRLLGPRIGFIERKHLRLPK